MFELIQDARVWVAAEQIGEFPVDLDAGGCGGQPAPLHQHIFCSFLALVLKQELQVRMREAGIEAE